MFLFLFPFFFRNERSYEIRASFLSGERGLLSLKYKSRMALLRAHRSWVALGVDELFIRAPRLRHRRLCERRRRGGRLSDRPESIPRRIPGISMQVTPMNSRHPRSRVIFPWREFTLLPASSWAVARICTCRSRSVPAIAKVRASIRFARLLDLSSRPTFHRAFIRSD